MSNTHHFRRRFRIVSEARLSYLDGKIRREHWEEVSDQQSAKVSRDRDPYEQMHSHTEMVGKDLERIQKSWLNWLTLRTNRLVRKRIDAEVERRLDSASAKWNSWYEKIVHWGERRELFAKGRLQVTKDQIALLEKGKSEMMVRQQRFSRAAQFLRGRGAVSRKELTTNQNLSKRLGSIQVGFERKVPVDGGRLQTLYAAREVEDLVRDALKGRVPEEQIGALLNIDIDGGASLRREIKSAFADDPARRKYLLRAVKKMKSYGRYKQLDALESDMINASPPRELLKRINNDSLCGQTLEFTTPDRSIRTIVVSHQSPMFTLRDMSKPKDDPASILILDTDGFLLERKGQSFRDHNLLGNNSNTKIRLPSSAIRAVRSAA